MEIRKIRETDREQLRKICISQASERARNDMAYGQYTLYMYCDPYVDAEDGFVVVDDNDEAVGYVFSVLTVDKYLKIMDKYVPLIRKLGDEYAARINQTLHMYDGFKEKYPSHQIFRRPS